MLRVGEERIEPLFKIGLSPLDLAQWFAIDDQLEAYRAERDALTPIKGAEVVRCEPGTEAAQTEVRALIEANLRAHHPQVTIPEDSGGPDLLEAARLVQDDLVLLRRDDSGWRLVAASLHFPSSWSLSEKFGLPLDQVHGNVPEFGPGSRNASLMTRIFDFLKVDQPVKRMNWSLYPEAVLHHPYRASDRSQNPGRHRLDADSFLRAERQTLVKLPESGDILFGIRIIFDPLQALRQHPEGLNRLKAGLLALTPAERDYKGLRDTFDDLLALVESLEVAPAAPDRDPPVA